MSAVVVEEAAAAVTAAVAATVSDAAAEADELCSDCISAGENSPFCGERGEACKCDCLTQTEGIGSNSSGGGRYSCPSLSNDSVRCVMPGVL